MTALPAVLLEQLQPILDDLPSLPSAVRYWDDYQDTFHTIRNLAETDYWLVYHDGFEHTLAFDYLAAAYGSVVKLVAAEMLTRLDMSSVLFYISQFESCALRFGPEQLMFMLVGLPPYRLREEWLKTLKPNCTYPQAQSLKAILHSNCIQRIGPWAPELRDYVSKLPNPKQDIYRTVRNATCFMPLELQSLVIDYFDEMASLILAAPEQVTTRVLRDTCILSLCHQHALRPGQIARIKIEDVRLHDTGAVHYSFTAMKQRRSQNIRRVTRRVKREWCPLFIEYDSRRGCFTWPERVPKDSYFGVKPKEVSRCIEILTEQITGESWTATDLRHTAAQRLADAGASHIALAEFMTHANINTANVYYDASPTQAQRLNQALAISPIYANVAEVARTRTIDKSALLRLPSDRQIGGVPHGIPIAGIGGCAIGQSGCIKNPVLSCYTCRKFMPVKDAAVHQSVVESLRPVVHGFADASRGNDESPAYTQLRRTLTMAQQVAATIDAGEDVTTTPEEIEPDE